MQARAKEVEEENFESESESFEASPPASPKDLPELKQAEDHPSLPPDQPPHKASPPKDSASSKGKEQVPLE